MDSTDPVRGVGNPCSLDSLSHGVTASPTISLFFVCERAVVLATCMSYGFYFNTRVNE